MIVTCSKCGQQMQAPDDVIGRKVSCVACGHKFDVPLHGNYAPASGSIWKWLAIIFGASALFLLGACFLVLVISYLGSDHHRFNKAKLAYRVELENKLPLNPYVEERTVVIRDKAHVSVNQGVVESIDLTQNTLRLRNPTNDKVKPDTMVLILNRDGVILLMHSESWLLDTLDYDESRVVTMSEKLRFPESLVFSKWALLAWDIKPQYALCVGSKTSYDALTQRLRQELQQFRKSEAIDLHFSYDIRQLLPEALPFSYGAYISTRNSSIVECVYFSGDKVQIHYNNQTEMRVKPNIQGYIFNKDGVVIDTFQDSWIFSSLAPAEEMVVTKTLSFAIPDELVFSRWARGSYDIAAAYFVLAGSSREFAEFARRSENRIRSLDINSLKH